MNIAITGGGTGGHLSIAEAIKDELNKRGIEPIFIGSKHGQDMEWFKDSRGFKKSYFFDTKSVVDKNPISKVTSLAKILSGTVQCREIFKEHNIEIIFSVGGYSAASASFASIIFSKDLFIHEQNAILGRLNKLLAKRSKMLFSSYLDEFTLTPYPVRDIFFENARVRDRVDTIIFLGGSQGATAVNEFAMRVAPILRDRGIKIIHQSGRRDIERLESFYKEEEIEVDLFSFSKSIYNKIKEADFAVARAGAGTMWELCASKLPALYIPYPYAANNHQFYNADFLASKGLSLLKSQDKIDIKDLEAIFKLDIKRMSIGVGDTIKRDGAKTIVDYILQVNLR